MKRTLIIALVLIVTLLGASIAAAQEPVEPPTAGEQLDTDGEGRHHGRRGARLVHHILEMLEVERADFREYVEANPDTTLAQAIEYFGGDVDAITEQLVTAIVERSDRDEAEVREHLEEKLNQPLPQRGERPLPPPDADA